VDSGRCDSSFLSLKKGGVFYSEFHSIKFNYNFKRLSKELMITQKLTLLRLTAMK